MLIDLDQRRREMARRHIPPIGGCDCDVLSAQAEGARMAGVYSSDYGALAPAFRAPYIPAGCDQQGRMRAGRRLTEADLDRRIAEQHERRPLPQLLLAKGAMTGPHRWPLLERLRRAWRGWRLERMGPRL